MSSEKKVTKYVDQLTIVIEQIQKALGPVLQQPLADILPKLTVIQRCELEALVVYALDTLFWVYLKINGVEPKDHPLMAELQRIQRYIEKINKAKDTQTERRSMTLNKEAAHRFIQNNLK